MTDSNRNNDPLTRGLGMAIALGALAVGAAAAFLNSERTRQMRQDLERQINDLSNRMDHELAARRPEIEDAIHRGRQVAVESLEKMKGVVEQGADKAQEYVHRASVKVSDAPVDMRDTSSKLLTEGATGAQDTVDSITASAGDTMNDVNTGVNQPDTAAGEEERKATAESGEAFSDFVGSAGGTIGSANTETAEALDEAAYDREHPESGQSS